MNKSSNKTDYSERLIKQATLASVVVALLIIMMKLSAWFITESLVLLSSLMDSMMDMAAAILTFIAARYALMPADEDHRFGHGKAEDIAALAQATFIAGSGVFIFVEGIQRLFSPHQIGHEWVGIVIMIFSTVWILLLLSFQRYVIEKTGSSLIKADSVHYKTDVLLNALVIISLLLVNVFQVYMVDAILAMVIAAYILLSAWEIGKESFDKLMDKELSDKERKKIIDIILSHKPVKGVHDLRTRISGKRVFIQFHLELDGKITLDEAHAVAEGVQHELASHFDDAEILIHEDPYTDKEIELQLGRVVSTRER